MRRILSWTLVLALTPAIAVGTGSDRPVAVSPGDGSDTALVAARCPTFSWSAIGEATGYELVVYRMVGDVEPTEPVLRRAFRGLVTGFTPPVDQCLVRGQRYAWSVRATSRDGGSKWSRPMVFRVASEPSRAEILNALDTLRRFLDAPRTGLRRETEEADNSEAKEADAPGESATVATPGLGALLSVDGIVAASGFSGDGSLVSNLDPASLAAGTAAIDISGNAMTASLASDLACSNCLTDLDIGPDAVGASELKPDSVDRDALTREAVSSDEIVDGSIAEADLGFDPVTQSELEDALSPGNPLVAEFLRCVMPRVPGWRYWDLGDGTILDCHTGNLWLKDASCMGFGTWGASDEAGTIQQKVAELNAGTDFGCADYTAGDYDDWEVPEIQDLCSVDPLVPGTCPAANAVDSLMDTSVGPPTVTNARGDAVWSEGDAFVRVLAGNYWSATELIGTGTVWRAHFETGGISALAKSWNLRLWPVRRP